MGDSIELSVAINILDRKIAKLTLEMTESPSEETKRKLESYLNIKEEIYKGNTSLLKDLINDMDN